MSLLPPSLKFGAIFTKKPVVVDKQPGNDDEDSITIVNHLDGTVYSMPADEFALQYEPVPGSDLQYRSKSGQWKDISLVLPGTPYRTKDGALREAVNGILVREKDDAEAFYEISPYYAIGTFNPVENDPDARDVQTQILNRAHLQGPIDDLQAMNQYAFKLLFVNRPYVMTLSGYSDASIAYAQSAETALSEIIRTLGDGKVGFIISPTAIPNSVDAVGTILSQRYTIPLIYVTAEEYLQYIEPSKFPSEIKRKLYEFTEKFFFKKPGDYSKATAWASNICVVMGGRDSAVQDAVNALQRGNKVIVIDDESLPQPAVVQGKDHSKSTWNQLNNRVGNASRYLAEQLKAFKETGRLCHESVGGLTNELLETLAVQAPLDAQVKIIRLSKDKEQASSSLRRQLKHLDAFLDGPDL